MEPEDTYHTLPCDEYLEEKQQLSDAFDAKLREAYGESTPGVRDFIVGFEREIGDRLPEILAWLDITEEMLEAVTMQDACYIKLRTGRDEPDFPEEDDRPSDYDYDRIY